MRKKGSYTVEAACIFPLILFFIISLCYLSLFLHDKLMIEVTLERVLNEAREETQSRGTITEQLLEQRARERLEQKLWITLISDVKGDIGLWKIQLYVTGKRRISIPIIAQLCGNDVSKSIVIAKMHVCEKIRFYHMLCPEK